MTHEKETHHHPAVSTADLEQTAGHAPLAEKKSPRPDSLARIHVHSMRNRLCDADGISAKAAIDGLVIAGLFADDSPEFIEEVSYSQEKSKEEMTIISITWGD